MEPPYSWEIRLSVAQPWVVRVCSRCVGRSGSRNRIDGNRCGGRRYGCEWYGGEWSDGGWFSGGGYEPDKDSLARCHVYLGGNSGLLVDRSGPLLNFPSLVGYD